MLYLKPFFAALLSFTEMSIIFLGCQVTRIFASRDLQCKKFESASSNTMSALLHHDQVQHRAEDDRLARGLPEDDSTPQRNSGSRRSHR